MAVSCPSVPLLCEYIKNHKKIFCIEHCSRTNCNFLPVEIQTTKKKHWNRHFFALVQRWISDAYVWRARGTHVCRQTHYTFQCYRSSNSCIFNMFDIIFFFFFFCFRSRGASAQFFPRIDADRVVSKLLIHCKISDKITKFFHGIS